MYLRFPEPIITLRPQYMRYERACQNENLDAFKIDWNTPDEHPDPQQSITQTVRRNLKIGEDTFL